MKVVLVILALMLAASAVPALKDSESSEAAAWFNDYSNAKPPLPPRDSTLRPASKGVDEVQQGSVRPSQSIADANELTRNNLVYEKLNVGPALPSEPVHLPARLKQQLSTNPFDWDNAQNNQLPSGPNPFDDFKQSSNANTPVHVHSGHFNSKAHDSATLSPTPSDLSEHNLARHDSYVNPFDDPRLTGVDYHLYVSPPESPLKGLALLQSQSGSELTLGKPRMRRQSSATSADTDNQQSAPNIHNSLDQYIDGVYGSTSSMASTSFGSVHPARQRATSFADRDSVQPWNAGRQPNTELYGSTSGEDTDLPVLRSDGVNPPPGHRPEVQTKQDNRRRLLGTKNVRVPFTDKTRGPSSYWKLRRSADAKDKSLLRPLLTRFGRPNVAKTPRSESSQ